MTAEQTQATPYYGPNTKSRAFTHLESHPVALAMMLLRAFGKEFLAWEPETTWVEIGLTFGVDPSAVNRQKIQAAKTVLVANSPFEHWDIFEAICFGLVGQPPRFDLIQQAGPMKCIFAMDVLDNLRGDRKPDVEVLKYCAASLHAAGFVYGPGSLKPANRYLARFVGADVSGAVQRIVESKQPVRLPPGSMLALQAAKSQAVLDFSRIQGTALLAQMDRLLK